MLSSESMTERRNKAAIFGPDEVVRKVDGLRRSPDEARWRVVQRLVAFAELHGGKAALEEVPA